MAITIGIICLLLTSVMFVQFKTVQVIEESGVSVMAESELRTEFTETRQKTEEVKSQIEEIQSAIDEYDSQSTNNQGTIDLLKADVLKAKCDLGYTDVKGAGLIITISDGPDVVNDIYERVTYDDLLFAVNELKYAGAEAISINDQRLVNTSYIKDISDVFIVVDGPRIIPPYTIKVIGDTKYLESVINIRGGLKDQLENYNKEISYEVVDQVYISKYDGDIEITYGN